MAKGNGKAAFEQQVLEALRDGFAQVNQRLDQIIDNTGAHWRDHERRLSAIEKALRLKK